MHPFDILKITPKTNCGRCGHPTCLAFAAAVAKTGADARSCPFIDHEKLPAVAPIADALDNLPRQHDLALIEHLKGKIAGLDFATIAPSLGAAWSPNEPDTLSFAYLGRPIKVSKQGIHMAGGEPTDPRDQILLYNYVHSTGGRAPTGNWVGMESLPNSISKIKTLNRYCEERLAQCLDGQPRNKVENIARHLAATMEAETAANLTLTVPVLPMIPERIIFWAADREEGFSAKVKVLFDHQVMDFLDLESLVFSAERMAERIAELAEDRC